MKIMRMYYRTIHVQNKGGFLRVIGIFMGALTFMAGTSIIPQGIIGVFQDPRSVADLGKGMGNIIALLLILFISYVLYSPDEFYRRHPRLITASGAIAAIGGLGIIIAAFFHPAFQEASLGPSFAKFFICLAGLLALVDAFILFIRGRRVKNV
jgi:hypothetical protein